MLKSLWKSEIDSFPFNHFFCDSCISSNVTEDILEWLISTNSWK
ncbi:2OG-Fe(II) oxygenase, partial [Escherichia coli]|nr:2OG-Fe(II) oxygenase [Escherichia coli]